MHMMAYKSIECQQGDGGIGIQRMLQMTQTERAWLMRCAYLWVVHARSCGKRWVDANPWHITVHTLLLLHCLLGLAHAQCITHRRQLHAQAIGQARLLVLFTTWKEAAGRYALLHAHTPKAMTHDFGFGSGDDVCTRVGCTGVGCTGVSAPVVML